MVTSIQRAAATARFRRCPPAPFARLVAVSRSQKPVPTPPAIDPPDLPFRDPLPRSPRRRLKHLVMGAHQNYTVAVDCGLDVFRLIQSSTQWFFGKDMFSGFCRVHNGIAVEPMWQSNINGIH